MGINGWPKGMRRCSECNQLFRPENSTERFRCADCVWDTFIKREIEGWRKKKGNKFARPMGSPEFFKHFPRPVSWREDMARHEGEGEE